MSQVKKQLLILGDAALFLINYSIIFVPFFLFIKLNNGKDLSTTLPFVLFYCLRLTGISLFRSIKNTVNSLNLCVLALYFGFFGSLLAAFGTYFFPLYILSSIFFGLGASWITPANLSIHYYQAQLGKKNKNNYPLIFLLLALLFIVFHFISWPMCRMLFYALFFVCSLFTVKQSLSYDLKAPLEDPAISKREFISFLLFFVLLFFLRTGRLLTNPSFFDSATIAASIIFLFLTLFASLIFKNIPHKIPKHLRLLTYLNGFISNYLFLFGSIYVLGIYGEKALGNKIFLPFFLGMTMAMILNSKIKYWWKNQLKTYSLIAIVMSLLFIVTNTSISLGIFLTSFFRTIFNSWLTNTFYQQEAIPQDKRILAKFNLQNRGSVLHQFILMGIILLLSKFDKTSIMMFLTLEVTKHPTLQMKELVYQANYIASSLIIFMILASLITKPKQK